ncbi:hypothetical protein WJ968_32820 [Achromobacter xylosoxidans]
MQMNQSMVDWYKAQVIAAVARKLNIPDWDFLYTAEQYDAITATYPEIGKLLEVFLESMTNGGHSKKSTRRTSRRVV